MREFASLPLGKWPRILWCALQPHACSLDCGHASAPVHVLVRVLQAAERQAAGAATPGKDKVRRVARAASATGHRTVLITRDGRRYTKKCAPCCDWRVRKGGTSARELY